ncbi:IclR family transcriptional regulator [Streptomyces sp. RLB1-33]|uniref:IclR family transcriptional regulator n=1 Tax=Streptomyces mirabilis TaxID=68239 RepID=UPI00143E775F|nr:MULTISPECIES: IclR family transcriptional regulator [Streptomyces]QIY74321.1 IclR family transcriptional regulator [Streptomyces sp. RLB1-33]QUW78714.1 IclR family transcriptional regulator [Streptomyces mirabilis]
MRGLNVLISVAESGEARVEEIAADAGIPVSTVYRYLRTLRELDLVEERAGTYVLGWRLLELSGQHLTHTRLVELGHSLLQGLTDSTGETAVLAVRVRSQAMCLRQTQSAHPTRVAFRINQLLPLYAGAGQRLLLAHAPREVIDNVLEQPMRTVTARTPDRIRLAMEMESVRTNGFLVTRGELSEGAVAVAVPVMTAGEVVCTLTVAGPENRCGPAWRRHAHNQLRSAGSRLTEKLDHWAASLPIR